MNDSKSLTRAIKAWRTAAKELKISVESPYMLTGKSGSVSCLAYLPDFGSPNGMVVGIVSPPDFETDQLLVNLAKEKGMFYSFINIEKYIEYNESAFKDMIEDWKYFGSTGNSPTRK